MGNELCRMLKPYPKTITKVNLTMQIVFLLVHFELIQLSLKTLLNLNNFADAFSALSTGLNLLTKIAFLLQFFS